jgi:hypothetical protein
LFLLAAVLPAGAGPLVGTSTYLSYDPYNGNFDLVQPLVYQMPDPLTFGPGPYPVFVWVPGTYESQVDPLSLLFVTQMAKRGFLSVSVLYNNTELNQTCKAYTDRAKGVFDATRSTSAVSTICKISGASCAKGLVTAGISQGGVLAVLARNYAPQVQAVYALSTGDYNHVGIGVDLTACLAKQNTAIPANRLTIVNGQADPAFGSQSSTSGASGFTCPNGSTQCWSPDSSGAGWYLVQNSQVTDGTADHCYIDVGSCNDKFDPKWNVPAASNWSLKANLDWLATLGTTRVFSQSGQ